MIHEIDLKHSSFPYLQRFFERFPVEEGRAFSSNEVTVDAARLHADLSIFDDFGTSGVGYWYSFLAGYSQYLEGGVDSSNVFLEHLRSLLDRTNFDPQLAGQFKNHEVAIDRVRARFDNHLRMLVNDSYVPVPVKLYLSLQEGGDFYLRSFKTRKYLAYSRIDGYHRIFSAKCAGWRSIPYVVELID